MTDTRTAEDEMALRIATEMDLFRRIPGQASIAEYARRLRAAWQAEQNAAGQEQLAKSAGQLGSVNGMDKPGETGLTPVPAAPTQAEPVARIHWPLWGEPIVSWCGFLQPRPSDCMVYAAPPAAPADIQDAKRYRWLRGDAGPMSARWPRWNLEEFTKDGWAPRSATELDTAIDAAIAAERGEGK